MVTPIPKPSTSLLKEIKLLKTFTDEELNKIISIGTSAQYEAYTNVIIEGELSWGLYLILSGTVGVYKTNKLTGGTYDVGQLESGSFFGEMYFVDENPRSATVRTLTKCSLFYISKDNFINFINQSSSLKLRFYENTIHNLVIRLRDLDENYVITQYQLWKKVLEKEELNR